MTLVILAIAVTALLYRLGVMYVRRSMRSFSSGATVWADLHKELRAFIEKEPPVAVAQLAIGLATAAGCGCFVRGVVATHYLPRFRQPRPQPRNPVEPAFNEVRSMEPELQEAFDRIMARVIVYDSYRNPVQGYLFRHIMWTFIQPQQSLASQLETKLAAFSVMSRRAAAF